MTTRNRELASIIDDSGNITATGNLTVSGTTTAVSSTNTTVSDPLIELNSGASSNSNDLGFVFERGSTGNNAAFIWDESNDTFALGTTTATGSSTGNMSISSAGITLSTINGLTFPTSDGSANQILKTDGSGALSFVNPTVTSIAVENESGNGSTTAFTLSADPGTENNTQVYIDGVYQFKNTYTVSGTTLTFDTAPANGASIEIIAITAGSVNVPTDDSVSTAKIQNNAVTADKIVANAVGISELNVSDGSNGQVLTTNGSGTLSFTSKTTSLTSIADADADTKIQVEESSDEDVIRFDVGGTEYMTLTSNGKLNVTEIAHISSGSLEIGNGDEKQVFDASGATIQFQTADTERMRIDGSGNVLVGKTDTALSSTGLQFSGVGGLNVTRNDGNLVNLNRKTSDGSIIEFYKDGVSVGSISTNGSNLPSSDRNFKRDISDLNLGLDLVNKLKPSQFRFKVSDENSPLIYGLIAQDLEESLTEEGIEKNSAWLLQHNPKEDVNESDYSLDYTALTPVLINAIQEQQTIIEDLKARIETLEVN